LLSGHRPPLADPALAGAELGRALGQRRVLLIVDDVWSRSQLEPFLVGGPATVRLVTTRQRSLLPDAARTITVEAMHPEEAETLLLAGLFDVPAGTVADLLGVTGRWPGLLALVNGAAPPAQRPRPPPPHARARAAPPKRPHPPAAPPPPHKRTRRFP